MDGTLADFISSSLDNRGHKCTQEKSRFTRRQRRLYNRVMSGIELALIKQETLRILCLTSSPQSTRDIHKSFRALVLRLRRRYRKFEYIAVKEVTASGLKHLHIIFKSEYIPQET